MRHWSQLATRNLRAKRVRTLGAVLAIALGVGSVVWVTCCYESVRQTISEWANRYIGRSHINIESTFGSYSQFPERAADVVRRVEAIGHVIPTLGQRLRADVVKKADLQSHPESATAWREGIPEVDLLGIDVETEFLVRDYSLRAGRMLRAGDQYACVLEADYAIEMGVELGDALLVWTYAQPRPFEFEIVGLMERRRIARFQKGLALMPLPMLQKISQKQSLISGLDVVLKDPHPTSDELLSAAARVKREVQKVAPNINIRSAAARVDQIKAAQTQQEMILVLLSSVAMLTSLFIILSTLSMGMIERIAQLGLLRCIGMMRGQLAWLILVEVFPLGLLGILLGIPIGLGLARATVEIVPDYVGQFTVSMRGIVLAVSGGLLTTLVAALLPAAAAATVTPLEAARPRAHGGRGVFIVLAGLLAIALLAAQVWVMDHKVQRSLAFVQWSSTAIVLLYLLYALLAPLAVWASSTPAVATIAVLVRVRSKLLQDQIGHAVWRSAGICCGLMVGLSLIVGLAVFNASFRAGWQFPKKFPEAYLWSYEQIGSEMTGRIEQIRGVRAATVANAMNAIVLEKPSFMEQLVRSVTWFLGCDPDTFFDLVQLEFVEGDREEALRRLKEGGNVLVAVDFARTREKHLGDTIRVWIGDVAREFRIAGVVDSPALDVAASYFQAQMEMRVAAVGSVIGANEDLRRLWNIDGFKLVLLNFDLPQPAPPADWPPPRDSPFGGLLSADCYDEAVPLEKRWQRQQERAILATLREEIQAPYSFVGTVRELKDQIDLELTNVTRLLAAVPAVALIVAAIGVANLMTANVTSRAKQIAMMRAIGATRGQILRLVIGEALVLGFIGSALGLALGMHLAWNTTTMTTRMWGFDAPFHVPWGYVGASVGLTVGLCILAGVLPARYASRTNIIDALHVA